MNFKMKCTQCGCEDLVEVGFPYETSLNMIDCGIRGEAAYYELEYEAYASTYICIRCGHFEFFNPELAQRILEKRQAKVNLQSEIDQLNHKIVENEKELEKIDSDIKSIVKQLENLDITIRKSNELKATQKEMEEKKQQLETRNKALLTRRDSLRKRLKDF